MRSKKITLTLFLLLIGVVLFVGWYQESEARLKGGWHVVDMYIDNKDYFDSLTSRQLNIVEMFDKKVVLLPYINGFERVREIHVNDLPAWEYSRNRNLDGELRVINAYHEVYNGVYEIEYVKNTKPKLVHLYNDRVSIVCEETYMSLEKPYIENR